MQPPPHITCRDKAGACSCRPSVSSGNMSRPVLNIPDSAPLLSPRSPDSVVSPRSVRFYDECVLIPDPQPRSRIPKIISKSYSLPLWKRKPPSDNPVSAPESEPDSQQTSTDDDHSSFRVSLPRSALFVPANSSFFLSDRRYPQPAARTASSPD